MKFTELGIKDYILKAIDKLGFEEATEIQGLAIPEVLKGIDVIGQAQTGTGKTFSYAIPIIEMVDTECKDVQALVLCPTRELTIQVQKEVEKLLEYTKKIKVATIYGGTSYEKQIRELKNRPQVVIGTPGRIIDHMNRKTLQLDHLKMLVLDEADEMLKMGFKDDLEIILKDTPDKRQTVLFSATMPPFIKNIAKNYQKNPVHLVVEKKTLTVEMISQEYYFVKRDDKKELLVRLLDFYEFKSSMIFCNTKKEVDELVTFLQKHEFSVDGLHGDLKQMVRDRVMNAFRSGSVKILVATDVAARGIDVSDVEVIFNYDIPQEDETYVHRIGRTGRAGRSGKSITFVHPRAKTRLKEIENYTKKEMTFKEIPSIEDINNAKVSKVYSKIVEEINSYNKIDQTQMINRLVKEGYDVNQIINALISLTVKEEKRQYKDIEIIPLRAERKEKGVKKVSKNNFTEGRKKFIKASLNIGKKESMRPQILLSFLAKTVDIRKENVGDIVIRKSGTELDITEGAYNRLRRLEGRKYQNTVIRVGKVQN